MFSFYVLLNFIFITFAIVRAALMLSIARTSSRSSTFGILTWHIKFVRASGRVGVVDIDGKPTSGNIARDAEMVTSCYPAEIPSKFAEILSAKNNGFQPPSSLPPPTHLPVLRTALTSLTPSSPTLRLRYPSENAFEKCGRRRQGASLVMLAYSN